MEILRADISHAIELAQMDSMCRTHPWSLKQWEHELLQENQLNFILIENASILSGIFGRMNNVEVEIFLIITHREYQKLGYGRRLLKYCLSRAKDSDQEVLLEVSHQNKAALSLYQSEGFKEVGVRKNYYSDGSDAILMKC